MEKKLLKTLPFSPKKGKIQEMYEKQIGEKALREKLNDLILTSLRTQWGLDIAKANEISGIDFKDENKELIDMYISMGLIKLEENNIKLTDEGKLYADGIAAEFFG